MAEITSVALGDHLVKTHPVVPMFNYIVVTISSTLADNADSIKILDIPAGYVLDGLKTIIAGTLGASATLQARVGTTAIAAASTAGGADTKAVMTSIVGPSTSEAAFNYLVGGADISAATTLTCAFWLCPAQSVALP